MYSSYTPDFRVRSSIIRSPTIALHKLARPKDKEILGLPLHCRRQIYWGKETERVETFQNCHETNRKVRDPSTDVQLARPATQTRARYLHCRNGGWLVNPACTTTATGVPTLTAAPVVARSGRYYTHAVTALWPNPLNLAHCHTRPGTREEAGNGSQSPELTWVLADGALCESPDRTGYY
ncbi:hypothetical protein BaRGS_00019633 [Batillaria attramentaria]|uniref:Uncharacterized protein n=1 Tax=Batillaria attramentaria TaxID=370345 RepID=A0ABD0KPQ0_9CAEN